ncbi:putative membrane protein [Lysobacter antibioticus]|nr:putative membrane protein [Lysobacter antibioticus]
MGRMLHPWFAEARLVAARGGAWRRGRTLSAAAAAAIALPLSLRAWGGDAAVLAEALPRLIERLPLPFGLLAIAVAYAVARGRSIALDEYLRLGWWAATPIEPSRATRSLILLAGLATLAAMAFAAAVLAACGGDRASLHAAYWVVDGGLALGAMLGLFAALRHRRHPAHRLREGARLPVFGLAWLDDARLPHLSDWQRREGVLRWRRGGHAWMIGAVLFGLPSSTGASSGIGVLLIAIALAWFSLILQACVAATLDADALLASTPRAPHRLAQAAWRYPGFAFVCAVAFVGIGAALLSLSWRAAPVLFAIMLVLSAPALLALRPVLHRSLSR